MIERVVDYLQASFYLSESEIIMKGFEPIPPVRFYKRGYRHPMGFRIYFGNPNSKKAGVVASGQTMQSLRNDQYLDAEIIDWMLSKGASISRVDLAVSEWQTFEGILELKEVEQWYMNGLISSTLVDGGCKEISELYSNRKEPQTIYIGDMAKRGQKGIFRAYDKGIQMDLGAYMCTRIELELRGKSAQATAKRLAQSNDIAGNFRSKFDVKAKSFDRLMDADAVSTTRGIAAEKSEKKEETENRWKWLIKQVAPALEQAIKDDRAMGLNDANLTKFLQRAGLLQEMREAVVANANKLHDNYLVSIGIHNGKFSSEELD